MTVKQPLVELSLYDTTSGILRACNIDDVVDDYEMKNTLWFTKA